MTIISKVRLMAELVSPIQPYLKGSIWWTFQSTLDESVSVSNEISSLGYDCDHIWSKL